jgi:hypothetical protein
LRVFDEKNRELNKEEGKMVKEGDKSKKFQYKIT